MSSGVRIPVGWFLRLLVNNQKDDKMPNKYYSAPGRTAVQYGLLMGSVVAVVGSLALLWIWYAFFAWWVAFVVSMVMLLSAKTLRARQVKNHNASSDPRGREG